MLSKTITRILTVSMLVVSSFALCLRADEVIFDNGAPQVGSVKAAGYLADSGNVTFTEAGNVFTPETSGSANQIDFAGFYLLDKSGAPPNNSFTVTLYATSSDQPTTIISSSTVSDLGESSLGTSSDGYTIYGFTGNLDTPFVLSTDSTYYVGISDTTTSYENFALDVTADQGSSPSDIEKSYDMASLPPGFQPGDGAISFKLVAASTVPAPEPSTWALLLAGFTGLYLIRRKIAVRS
jgi:hypothetical protein